jgi:hypothetical protein
MCISIFIYNVRVKPFSISKEQSNTGSKIYVGLHIKFPLFLPEFNDT